MAISRRSSTPNASTPRPGRVERYLTSLNLDAPLDTETRATLADALAPTWPHEIITTLFEYGDRARSGAARALDDVLDGAARAVTSGGFLDDQAAAALPKRDAAPALHLSKSLAKAGETLEIEGLAGAKRWMVRRHRPASCCESCGWRRCLQLALTKRSRRFYETPAALRSSETSSVISLREKTVVVRCEEGSNQALSAFL